MAQNNIPKLSQAQKELLLSKSPYSLPDNPSDKHFSASQIKRKMYEGLLVLFDYLNAFIDSVNSNVTLSNQDLQTIQSDIGTLQSFFENGICKKATADANGNNIASTYETKDDALSKIATALAEAKAYADALVQRSALVSTLGEASTTINGLMSAEDKAHLDLIYSVFGSSPEETSRTLASAIELLSEAEKTYFVSDEFDDTAIQTMISNNDKVMYYDNGWKQFEDVEAYQTWADGKTLITSWLQNDDSSLQLSSMIGEGEFIVCKNGRDHAYLVTANDYQYLFQDGDEIKTACSGKAYDRKHYNGTLYAYKGVHGKHLYLHAVDLFFSGGVSSGTSYIKFMNFHIVTEDPTPWTMQTLKDYVKNRTSNDGSSGLLTYYQFPVHGVLYSSSANENQILQYFSYNRGPSMWGAYAYSTSSQWGGFNGNLSNSVIVNYSQSGMKSVDRITQLS